MNEAKIDGERLFTSTEVGELLQVNPSSVKNWVNEGRLPAFRTPGGHRRIRAADLVAFLEEHKMPIPSLLGGLSRRRMLVVDDDALHLKALGRMFKRLEERVHVVMTANGIDALVMVGSFKPHLIVLDVFMPELDGIEVCRRLKANPETHSVVVLVASANLSNEVERNALHAGARRCLQKPIDIDVVLNELGAQDPMRRTGAP